MSVINPSSLRNSSSQTDFGPLDELLVTLEEEEGTATMAASDLSSREVEVCGLVEDRMARDPRVVIVDYGDEEVI